MVLYFVAIMKLERKRIKFIQMICAEVSIQVKRLSRETFAECLVVDQQEKDKVLSSELSDGELLILPKMNNSTDNINLHEQCALHHNEVAATDYKMDKLIKKRCCCLVHTGVMFVKPFIRHLITDMSSKSQPYLEYDLVPVGRCDHISSVVNL